MTLVQETCREQLEEIDQLKSETTKYTIQINTLQQFAFLQIQTLLDTEKDYFIEEQIQHTCAKYRELNTTAKIAKFGAILSCIRKSIPMSRLLTGQF